MQEKLQTLDRLYRAGNKHQAMLLVFQWVKTGVINLKTFKAFVDMVYDAGRNFEGMKHAEQAAGEDL
jgi:hypothetical protein